jgi:hypothetical protein
LVLAWHKGGGCIETREQRTDLIPAVLTSLFMKLRPDLDAKRVGKAVGRISRAMLEVQDETRLWTVMEDALEELEAEIETERN